MTVVPFPAQRVTLGGSDAAAAAGIDPYRSPVALWLEKTGRDRRPETEAMLWGKRLEQVVMDVLAYDGCEVVAAGEDGEVRDPERPWLVGHPDGYLGGDEYRVLEVKTASRFTWPQGAGVPLHYQAQVQVYLHLTGCERALVAALVDGQRLERHDLVREPRAVAALLEAMAEMVGYVERDERPPVDASDSTRDALHRLYGRPEPGRIVRLQGETYRLIQRRRAHKERLEYEKEQVQAIDNVLKAEMGAAEVAVGPHDEPLVRWSAVETQRLDVKGLRAAHPAIAERFVTQTTTRRFSVT